jgi:hypothetical protein
MELKEYILSEINGQKRNVDRVLKDLTQAEYAWRPASGCNSIGLIIFHIAKSEDNFVQAILQGKPTLWESEKWYQKLNIPQNEDGAHYNIDQVNAFPVPPAKELVAFFNAVREKTIAYVAALKAADLDKKFTMPHFGDITAAGMCSLIVGHAAGHIGEMSYIRGIQRGLDK